MVGYFVCQLKRKIKHNEVDFCDRLKNKFKHRQVYGGQKHCAEQFTGDYYG